MEVLQPCLVLVASQKASSDYRPSYVEGRGRVEEACAILGAHFRVEEEEEDVTLECPPPHQTNDICFLSRLPPLRVCAPQCRQHCSPDRRSRDKKEGYMNRTEDEN